MRILSLQRLESLQTAYHLFIELGADLSALRIKSKLADIAFSSGDFETALAWIHTVNAERRKLPKVGLGLMDSLNSEAIFLEYLGAYEESIALQKEILALAQHHNSIGFQQRASLSIAGILGVLRRPEAEIETWLAQADEFNRLYYNDQISLAMVEGFRAYVAYHSLDYERARSYFLQAFERVKSEIRLSSFYLMMLGLCEVKLQNFAEARRYFLSIIGEGISYINQLIILYGYAELAYTEKDYQWSAELASALYAAKAMTEPYKSYTKDLLDLLQTVLSEEEYQAALERGKHLDLAQVIQRFSLK